MSLTVGGTTNQRKLVEDFLRRICWRARVDPSNGKVTLVNGPAPQGGCNPDPGCECLKKLIDSKKKCTIHPEKDPKKKIHVPKSPLGPAHDESLDKSGGGITVGGPSGFVNPAKPPAGGQPGTPESPGTGSDADVYIDMTRNNGDGYNHGMDTWLILAHELTSGHAFHLLGGTCAVTKNEAEAQAIESENKIREFYHIPLRTIPKDTPSHDHSGSKK